MLTNWRDRLDRAIHHCISTRLFSHLFLIDQQTLLFWYFPVRLIPYVWHFVLSGGAEGKGNKKRHGNLRLGGYTTPVLL